MAKLFLILMGCYFTVASIPGQSLRVQINGIRSNVGEVRVSFFANSHEFGKEAPRYEKVIPKTGVKNGKITVMISDLPAGRYGIAVLDDENANKKMDYRWLKPAEGYGFSDLTPAKLRRPAFEEFQFDYDGGDKTVMVALLYW